MIFGPTRSSPQLAIPDSLISASQDSPSQYKPSFSSGLIAHLLIDKSTQFTPEGPVTSINAMIQKTNRGNAAPEPL